jgi:tetratricopeptide (TPR) repeat protein
MFKAGAWKALILREGLNYLAENGSDAFFQQVSDWKSRIQNAVIDRHESNPALAIQQLKEVNSAFEQIEEIGRMFDRVTNGEAEENLAQLVQAGRCLFHEQLFVSALMCFEVAIRASEPHEGLCLMAAEAAARANRQATHRFYRLLSERAESTSRGEEKNSAQKTHTDLSRAMERRWIRKNVQIPILISFQNHSSRAKLLSISAGGGLIEVRENFSLFRLVEVFSYQISEIFEFTLSGEAKKIYQLRENQFGFSFLNLAPENQDEINHWILGADLKSLFA